MPGTGGKVCSNGTEPDVEESLCDQGISVTWRSDMCDITVLCQWLSLVYMDVVIMMACSAHEKTWWLVVVNPLVPW